jgi:hypothetical protein
VTKIPQTVGDTFNDILSWRWDRSRMCYVATHGDSELRVLFTKVGGRWSKTFADGTPNVHQKRHGYWTPEVDNDRPRSNSYQFATADEAKDAAAKMYVQMRAWREKKRTS